VALGVIALAGAYAIAHAVGSRRTAAMRAAEEAARTAVAAARAGGGSTWAPERLLAAERAWRDALADQRAAEARVWPVPDAAPVVEAFGAAERAAHEALALARERRSAASDAAASLIAAADAAVAASEVLAAKVHLGFERRLLVAQARAAVTEARVYAREGDFGRATVRAREAAALTVRVGDHAAAVAARYADADTLARWRRWKEETIAWSRREGRAAIVVSKEPHTLTLYVRGQAARTYRVDLGFNWIADKSYAGDGATPEGRYRVVERMKSGSIYHKALRLDYPNPEDRAEYARLRRSGAVSARQGIGGLIEIHGEGGRGRDWTNGCVAMTNPDIDDMFDRVGIGTPVTIVGNDSYGSIADLAVQRGTSTPVDGRRH
jgi:lipoprotein-anchoring transpeptidase ErfK/SrfK